MSEEKRKIILSDSDWFLQSLINIINGKDLEIGITLNVGGFLVSGLLVSGHHYFEGFAQDFASIFAGTDEAQIIKESFFKCGEIYTKEKEENEEIPPPSYIHLKSAKFFNANGNPIPSNRGVWWRGRISEVSGFVLGILSANNS